MFRKWLVFILIQSPCILSLICRCEPENNCPDDHNNFTCTVDRKGKCYSSTAYETLEDGETMGVVNRKGCLQKDSQIILQCKAHKIPHHHPANISCCSDEDFCNENILLHLASTTPPPYSPTKVSTYALFVAIAVLCVIICSILIGIVLYCVMTRRHRAKTNQNGSTTHDWNGNESGFTLLTRVTDGSTYRDDPSQHMEMSMNSGSGTRELVERTIAKQLEFKECVGRGRYGEVWRGRYRGEDVAIKVFVSIEEPSWQREKEIYETCMLRHENILGFIAADIRSNVNAFTELLMICDYHPYGSVYDFLQVNAISGRQMLQMGHAAAAGLAHLHEQIRGTASKPAIAHRDIKSKNILVKKDYTCCIADFGLAVRLDIQKKCLIPDHTKLKLHQGTKRYMAPELLAPELGKFRIDDFESFKRADVYSFSLVLWEMARRCDLAGHALPFELPYQHDVASDPSFDEMKAVVALKRIRPQMEESWKGSSPLLDPRSPSSFCRLMEECWYSEPESRLTADRIKKRLRELLTMLDKINGNEGLPSNAMSHRSLTASSIVTGSSLVPSGSITAHSTTRGSSTSLINRHQGNVHCNRNESFVPPCVDIGAYLEQQSRDANEQQHSLLYNYANSAANAASAVNEYQGVFYFDNSQIPSANATISESLSGGSPFLKRPK